MCTLFRNFAWFSQQVAELEHQLAGGSLCKFLTPEVPSSHLLSSVHGLRLTLPSPGRPVRELPCCRFVSGMSVCCSGAGQALE